ncbi:uncharacterized protein LOC129578306 isoform X2 [Sitodiplosis mosellana]|uniref:uncharacterized protein LOC129578306 isoform X2 n=1 Tax=Sitodiplosis mosellana TaxID=263140 RepID=UPI002444506F|nr:uncharacterized protein LOC129578306 isoform X2 [Sitodiplosis mosellana]
MLSGDQGNGYVSELAEGHTYIRGRCKQLGNLYSPSRDDGRYFSNSDYEFLLHTDEFGSPVDAIEKQSEDLCRRVSMTPGDVSTDHACKTPTNETSTPLPSASTDSSASDRRSSRDIGIQAFSIEIEEEKKKLIDGKNAKASPLPPPSQAKTGDNKRREFRTCSIPSEPYFFREHRPSILLRRDSCHFHKLISPRNEIIVAHCPGTTPLMEYADSFETYKSHDGSSSIEMSSDEFQKPCYCFDHCHDSMDSAKAAHRHSTSSSDSSTITKIAVENAEALAAAAAATAPTVRRPSKWKSSLVYFMDPCIEDSENTAEGEYHESEQEKPLLKQHDKRTEATVTTSFEKRSNFRKKSVDDSKSRSVEGSTARNVEGIELASEVCPFGLAKNLEKQICIIPSRKKKSSGRPSFLKLVTFILIGSAILITSAAIKEAYY